MDGRESVALNASLLLDGEGKILEGNRDAEVFLERPLEEVRKVPLASANPALHSALRGLISKTRRGRGVENYSLAYKVGKRLMRLSISATPYPLEALGTTGTLITLSSTGARAAPIKEARETKAKAAEPEKAEKAEKAEKIEGRPELWDILPEPLFTLDLEANFTYVNPVMCELMGHTREEVLGRPLSFFLAREEAKKALDSLVEAALAAPWRGELEFQKRNGTTCHIAVTICLLKDENDVIEGLLGMGRDYGDEARIRREREEELKRVWTLLEKVGVAVATVTPDLRVTLLSHSAEELLGTSMDRAIGETLPGLFPKKARGQVKALLERSLAGEEIREAEVFSGEVGGVERTVQMEIRPAVTAEGRPREYMVVLTGATRELTKIRKLEAQLRESSLRNSLLELALGSKGVDGFLSACLDFFQERFSCSGGAVFKVEGKKARLKAWNGIGWDMVDAVQALKIRPGYEGVCSMLGKLPVEIRGGVPREGWEEVRSLVDKVDGLLPVLRDTGWRDLLLIPLRSRDVWGALVLVDYDHEKVEEAGGDWFPAAGVAMVSVLAELEEGKGSGPGASGKGGGESGAAKAAAAVEEKAAGKDSPEVKGVIRNISPTMAAAGGQEHALLEHAQEVKAEEPDFDHLTLWQEHDLESPAPSPEGIEMSSFLWELKDTITGEKGKADILLELEEGLPKVHTDPRLLREILLQVMDNAIRYSPPDSPVVLGAERWGDEVLLRVEDQGPGIPQEIVDDVMGLEVEERVFREQEGRTSGLYRCRRYIHIMGGSLTIKVKRDQGTTVYIRLYVLPFLG